MTKDQKTKKKDMNLYECLNKFDHLVGEFKCFVGQNHCRFNELIVWAYTYDMTESLAREFVFGVIVKFSPATMAKGWGHVYRVTKGRVKSAALQLYLKRMTLTLTS